MTSAGSDPTRAGETRPQGAALDRSVFIRPIAHRGLHDPARGLIENTAPAFLAAIAKGYGIECDLQAAIDGSPMVFHDALLDRLIDASGPIAFQTPESLARYRYKGQQTGILSLRELLDLVAGRVPLLVEVKSNARVPAGFLDNIARLAAAYRGPIALMSFNRDLVAELGPLAPEIPRGIVVGAHELGPSRWTRKTRGRDAALVASLDAAPAGIAFVAIEVKLLEAARTWINRRAAPLPLFTWTVRSAADRAAAAAWADAPIFEGYEP
jgi:glycerophosphoryl diester phosphodiesterase